MMLPLGVHFFCVTKRNRTKQKASLIALFPKIKLCVGVDNNSLDLDTCPLMPPNSLVFGGNIMEKKMNFIISHFYFFCKSVSISLAYSCKRSKTKLCSAEVSACRHTSIASKNLGKVSILVLLGSVKRC